MRIAGRVPGSVAADGAAASPAQQYNGLIGGNPNVKPEVGITKDIGFVFTPTFLPGFNATIDYTDIKITNLMNSYGPNTVQPNCLADGIAQLVLAHPSRSRGNAMGESERLHDRRDPERGGPGI